MSVDLDMNARQQSRGAQAADLQMLEYVISPLSPILGQLRLQTRTDGI